MTPLAPRLNPPSAAEIAASPTTRYPAWAMELYPSIRLMLVWVIATRLPTVIEMAAMAANMFAQSPLIERSPKASKKMRITTAKPAALLPTDR